MYPDRRGKKRLQLSAPSSSKVQSLLPNGGRRATAVKPMSSKKADQGGASRDDARLCGPRLHATPPPTQKWTTTSATLSPAISSARA